MMAERDDSELVKLNLRMHERLRAKIEADAQARGLSMNAAIVDRLERSLGHEQTLAELMAAQFGGASTVTVLRALAATAAAIASIRRFKDWPTDPDGFAAVRAAWDKVLDALAPDVERRPVDTGYAQADFSAEEKQAVIDRLAEWHLQIRHTGADVLEIAGFRSASDATEKPKGE